MKILDCTLRDGGYYTNWDFDRKLVENYIQSLNNLPIDYIELGYRSKPLEGYLGEYFYLPLHVLKQIKKESNKKLVVMLNEKDVDSNTAKLLLNPCKLLIDMVRVAVDPNNFDRAIALAHVIKEMGFEVGFNVMYMSKWKEQPEFLNILPKINGLIDYFYMVDSYGGVYPEDVKEIYNIVSSKIDVPIGFHGHNNLELALVNTLTAISCGAQIVDATIIGMGRGAGNLKTELLLTSLNAKNNLGINFNALSAVVDDFTKLQQKHKWGTNLPYMVSGANSLPQKQVMEWVSNRYYSLNSIIRALTNVSKGQMDNRQLPQLDFENEKKYQSVLIIGGGPSVNEHANAIQEFLNKNSDIVIIHASSKNAMCVKDINNDQFFCLVGNEGYRLEKVFGKDEKIIGKCILPPFPRTMGTYIPDVMEGRTFELNKVDFTKKFNSSHTAIAIQTALFLKIDNVYVVGYDGYSGESIDQKEQELFRENEFLFSILKNKVQTLKSLTPTQYESLHAGSIYANLID